MLLGLLGHAWNIVARGDETTTVGMEDGSKPNLRVKEHYHTC